ncbi:MAG: HK97 gp10 family phage protein [Cohnella sp.]|nr:HK97 gp10 family phage protein [Cohnella sp.]
MSELKSIFNDLRRVPQTVATKSARAGGSIVLRAAKKNAPKDEGDLERAIILRREKTKVRGKAVYDVTIDRSMNAHFVKISKDGNRSYYPASQEYGFMTVDGQYVPGYRYLRNSADDNRTIVEKKILDVTKTEVDKALRKGRKGK